jgi:hypothetical protein
MIGAFLRISAFAGLLGVVALLGMTGCGSDDSSAGAAANGEVTVKTGSLSKAQFVKQADQLCKETRRQFQGEYEDFVKKEASSSTPPTNQTAKLVDAVIVPDFSGLVDQIGSLGAPSGDEQEISAFLTALQQRLQDFQERPSILEQTVTPFARTEKLARAYGLTGCAESFS